MINNQLPMGTNLDLIEEERVESENFINFLAQVGKPGKNLSRKYSIKLREVNKLFTGSGWENLSGASGHAKFRHRITRVVVEYSAHDDPVDPGAVQTLAEQIQLHINVLYYQYFGFSPRVRKQRFQINQPGNR